MQIVSLFAHLLQFVLQLPIYRLQLCESSNYFYIFPVIIVLVVHLSLNVDLLRGIQGVHQVVKFSLHLFCHPQLVCIAGGPFERLFYLFYLVLDGNGDILFESGK